MDTWSGLYLRDQLGASAAVAAHRVRRVRVRGALRPAVRGPGAVRPGHGGRRSSWPGFGSPIGGTIAVATDQVFVVALAFLLLGFTIVGRGAGGVRPGRASPDEDPTNAIAAVTTVGYTGFIWSPPLLGWIAQTFSLRAAMSVIVVATFGIIGGGLARTARRRAR